MPRFLSPLQGSAHKNAKHVLGMRSMHILIVFFLILWLRGSDDHLFGIYFFSLIFFSVGHRTFPQRDEMFVFLVMLQKTVSTEHSNTTMMKSYF